MRKTSNISRSAYEIKRDMFIDFVDALEPFLSEIAKSVRLMADEVKTDDPRLYDCLHSSLAGTLAGLPYVFERKYPEYKKRG